jgi:hypothetical protein
MAQAAGYLHDMSGDQEKLLKLFVKEFADERLGEPHGSVIWGADLYEACKEGVMICLTTSSVNMCNVVIRTPIDIFGLSQETKSY